LNLKRKLNDVTYMFGCLAHSLCVTVIVLSTEFIVHALTLILLTWRIWWAPNNVSRWQMGFNSAFKGLKPYVYVVATVRWLWSQRP